MLRLFKFSLICILLFSVLTAGKRTVIKLATLAPEGTDWHGMLVEFSQKVKKAKDFCLG